MQHHSFFGDLGKNQSKDKQQQQTEPKCVYADLGLGVKPAIATAARDKHFHYCFILNPLSAQDICNSQWNYYIQLQLHRPGSSVPSTQSQKSSFTLLNGTVADLSKQVKSLDGS